MAKIKNLFIFALLKLASILWKKNQGEGKAVLVVSTTGLGDTLWAVPALRHLKESRPENPIILLTSPLGKELLAHCPYVDHIFILSPSIRLVRNLRKISFKEGFVFHASQRSALPLCHLAGASDLAGTEGMSKGLDRLLKRRFPKKNQHEILRRLEIVGAKNGNAELEFFFSPHDHEKVSSLPEGLLIGMQPGAKDAFKKWPAGHFAALGKKLWDNFGATIIFTGNAGEKTWIEEIAKSIPHALNFAGKLPLRSMASMMRSLKLFITNDTGPMHIAFALKIPTIALFCATDPKLCGPLDSSQNIVIKKEKTCSPCLMKSCRRPFCIEQIGPGEVFEKASSLIQKVQYA